MDNLMALEILKVIKKGVSNGRETIKSDIRKMDLFMDKSDNDFYDTFDKLEELGHIIDDRSPATNNMQTFILNNEKDYIEFYQNKVNTTNNDNNLELQINQLNLDKLKYEVTIRDLQKELSEAQLGDIPKNAEDRKTDVTWTVVLGVIAIVEFFLLLFGVNLKP